MKICKKFLARSLSLLVSLTILIGICPKVVKAQTDDGMTWVIPCQAYELIPNWWDSIFNFNEIENDGGWRFEWSSDAVGVRQGLTKGVPLSGMTLKFEKLESVKDSGVGEPSFGILLTDSIAGNMDPVEGDKAGKLALIAVDCKDGEIRFENDGIGINPTNNKIRYVNDGTVLVRDDKIKYENLKDKKFSISFHEAPEGAFEIWVDIEGQTTIKSTQNLTATMISKVDYLQNLANIYVGLTACRGNVGTTKIDFKAVGYPKVDDGSSEDSANWFAPKSTFGFISTSDVSKNWGNNITISDLPKNGGIRWKCQHNGVGMRQGWKQSFALDGLSLKFTGLDNPKGKASFLIYLGDTPSGNFDPNASNCMAYALIALDTINGELRFENDGAAQRPSDGAYRILNRGTTLIQDDLLKYDSLKGKDFNVSFIKAEGGYFVQVTVGEESVQGLLTDEMLGKIVNMKKLDRVYVGLGNNNGNEGYTTLDLVGIGPFKKTDIARKELTVNDIAGQNYWPAMLSYDNAPTGGVRFTYTNAFRNIRIGLNNSASLNGMYLKLNNLTKNKTLNPKVMFVLDNGKAVEMYDTSFALVLDTNAGTLNVCNKRDMSGQQTIITNDALKYNNLAGRTIVIRTFADDAGGYDISVRVGSDAPVTGKITKDILDISTKFTAYDSAYITLHPGVMQNAGEDQSFSIDVVEYWSSVVNPTMVINAINNIGDVSLEKAAALRNARALYEQLPNIDKLDVTNLDKLLVAELEFAVLAVQADKDLTFMSTSNAKLSGSSEEGVLTTLNSWKQWINVSDIPTGGMTYNFTGSKLNVREGYAGNLNLDGLFLQFDRFTAPSASSAKFALMIGNGSSYGVEYSDSRKAYPLTLVLDPAAGTITCMPKGEVVITNDKLKLENLSGERFSYLFDEQNNGDYILKVKVGDTELTGTITAQAVEAAISLTKPTECGVMLTAWEDNTTFSLDFIGAKQTKLTAADVMALIDGIGLVGIDSGNAINAALAAYESLSDKVKIFVDNYDILISLQNYYLGLDYNTMISDAEELIDEIGKVGYKSGDAIRNAKVAFDRLNSSQQAKVSNASVLQKAINVYDALTSDKIIYESYAYPVNLRFTSTSAMGEWWQKTTFNIVENKALRINFEDAIRDVRNGPSTAKSLDGLILRIANITPDREGDGTGTKLSLQIGTRDNNYRGDVNLTAFALVLDTYEGAIYGYPGNRLMLKDEAFKQANIEGKEILMRVDKTEENLYRLQVQVAEKTFYTVIPTSLIDNSTIDLDPDSVKIALSPWVNNEDGVTDNSTHSFSVDFLSCQSTGRYSFEDLYDLMERINLLPKAIDISDEDTVLGLSDAYRELPRTMRAYVSNYAKLSSAIDQLYELNAEDVSTWDNEKYNSPETGENSMINISLAVFAVSIIALAGLTLLKRKSKRS